MSKNIRQFKSFQNKRRFDSINEAVTEVGNVLKISNIEIKKSDVKSYISRVKQEMGRDLSVERSLSDIAEDMVKYSLENGSTISELPTEALLGGDPEMTDEPIETDEIDVDAELEGEETLEETPEFEEPTGEEDTEEGLDDLEGEVTDEEPIEGEEGEVTEEPIEGEEGEVTDEEEEDTTEEGEGEEEEEELPI